MGNAEIVTVNIAGKAHEITRDQRDRRMRKSIEIVLKSRNHENNIKDEIKRQGKPSMELFVSEMANVMKKADFDDLDQTFQSFIKKNKKLKEKLIDDKEEEAAEAIFNKIKEEANIVASSRRIALFAGGIMSNLTRTPFPYVGQAFAAISKFITCSSGKISGDKEVNKDNIDNKNNAIFRPKMDIQNDIEKIENSQTSAEELKKIARTRHPETSLKLAESNDELDQETQKKFLHILELIPKTPYPKHINII